MTFCPPVRNGQECVVMDEGTGKPHISESLCIGCGICVNKCPHDALIITQLPAELESDMIHRYSLNGFRLFRLPTPSKESVVGILGPNGCGKTTTIGMILGLLKPTSGKVLINGINIEKKRVELLNNLNFISPYIELPKKLTVKENLIVYGKLYGVKFISERIKYLSEKLRLEENSLNGIIPNEVCELSLDWDDQNSFNITENMFCEPYPICILSNYVHDYTIV